MGIDRTNTSLITRLLAASAQRSDVIASNIANSNTPGYTRRSLQFESLLSEALERGRDTSDVNPVAALDTRSPARGDGNNVQAELELTALRSNKMLYDTYVSILQSHFRMLEASVTSGR